MLQSMADDHAIAIQSQTSSMQTVLDGNGNPQPVAAAEASDPWQSIALEMQTLTEKASLEVLGLFAATDTDEVSPAIAAAIGETARDLQRLTEFAGRLRRKFAQCDR